MERRRRLPGVSFQVESSTPEETLPRMDIAAFVGLASAGPLNAPVLIEDPVRFRDIFGPDLPLTRDARGTLEYARLAPTVEAFFRNGGRRCYVVRVTGRADDGTSLASTARFLLPGMVEVRPWIDAQSVIENLSGWAPTQARARSEGTWSEALRSGCTLTRQVLTLPGMGGGALTLSGGQYRLELSSAELQPGDLLCLTWLSTGLVVYLCVRALEAQPGKTIVFAQESDAWWFYIHPPEDLDLTLTAPSKATWLSTEGPVDLVLASDPAPPLTLDTTGNAPTYALAIETPDASALAPALQAGLQPGELVQVTFGDGSALLLPLDAVDAAPTLLNAKTLTSQHGLWPIPPATPPVAAPYVERLSLRLHVWQESELKGELKELTFHPAHTRCWARLPTDQSLWERLPAGVPRTVGPLDAESSTPRFAVAGPGCPDTTAAFDPALALEMPVWLPLGVLTLSATAAALPELTRASLDPAPAATRLTRDGLAQFNADMFLDPALATLGTDALETEAFHRFYVQGLPLLGLHALTPLEEFSLLSVPDASLRHWSEVAPPVLNLLNPPTLAPIDVQNPANFDQPTDPDDCGEEPNPTVLHFAWSAVSGAVGYQLELSYDASFSHPQRVYADSLTSATLNLPEHCPTVLYFRVRATDGHQVSPWSNTERVKAPQPTFGTCGETWLTAPLWQDIEGDPTAGDFTLHWEAVPGADHYCIELSTDPSFAGVTEARLTTELSWTLPKRQAGATFIRLQAWNGDGALPSEPQSCVSCATQSQLTPPDERGPFSTTLIIEVMPDASLQLEPSADYSDSDLRAVQLSALRFAAARADQLVVLSLPLHYRSAETLAHVSRLNPTPLGSTELLGTGDVVVQPLSFGESRALSYGALYHPWLAVSVAQPSSPVSSVSAQSTLSTFIPPDGPMVGLMASLSLKKGAWMAPANVPFDGGLALFPPFSVLEWQAAYATGINLLRQDTRGFSAQSAETLSLEPELAPLNVRRLMILLRRLCLREGQRLVFAPNTPQLRSRVQRAFERVLNELFVRGALAGSSPDRAYQVVADASLNPPQSVDDGRLVLELKVAPSKPLSFVTVRLVQQGAEALAVRETS